MSDNKHVLGLADLFGMSIGMVIGTGVMVMTGIGIGYTGRSVNVAYLIAILIQIVSSIAPVLMLSTARFTGGQYSQISVLAGKAAGGIYTYLSIALILQSVLTMLSLGEYALGVFPNLNTKLFTLVILTVLIILNMTYLKSSAIVQNIMVVILVVALGCYVVLGWPHLVDNYTAAPDFMTNGVMGLLQASIYVSSALGGATYIADFSDRMKNPTRDMPIAIIGTIFGVGVLYCLIATVAGGVLPVEQIANQPLSVGAASFMSGGLYTFFVVGGAIFALLTTINSSLGSKPYPMKVACNDGWLPKALATTNKKFGTPHWLFLVVFLLVGVPLALGIDISLVATSVTLVFSAIRILMSIAAMRLPVVMPELWNKSKFHMSNSVLYIVCGLSLLMNVASMVITLTGKSMSEILMNLGMLAICVVLTLIRYKKANISASFEER